MAIDFALSADQEALADVFGAFFDRESPADVVRDAEPLGFSRTLWDKLRAMEGPAMAAPEDRGGAGASLSALVVVAERLGASVAPVPLIEHWLASTVHPLPEIVSGEQVAALALRPAVDGIWPLVPGGAVSDWVVGVDGSDLVAVAAAPPLHSPPNHADAPLADRSARVGERVVLGPAALAEPLLDRWRTLTASALVGVAHRAMRMGVDYVLQREQFGRLVGSFQSVQHGLADLPGLIDGARFLTHKAAWAHDEGLDNGLVDNGLVDNGLVDSGLVDMDEGIITAFSPLAAMALLQAGEAAAVSADRSLHYHGGYGFSREYDIQLYFRRARGWANVLADPARERLRLADLLWPVS